MSASSRRRARSWPYPRHRQFEERLQQAAAAWFAGRGAAVHPRYPYILGEMAQWPQNIIDPAVASYIRGEQERRVAQGQGFPLHKYIHHGLSSQAMLFNLVGPLIVRKQVDALAPVLVRQGLTWPAGIVAADLEYEDRTVFHEDAGQPTSIDLVLRDGDGRPGLFIEAKLVEKGFGGCSVFRAGDCDGRNPVPDFSRCYLHHLGRRYWILLEKHGFLAGPLGSDSMCILALHYQFFREVLFAVEHGGTFVLLSDARSPTFECRGRNGQRRGLLEFLLGLVPAPLHARVGRISIQQVVAHLKDSGQYPWIGDFEEKYGLKCA